MPLTVLSGIIVPALRLIQVMGAPGRGSSTETNVEALDILNAVIDDWNTQELFAYSTQRVVLNIVAGQQTYQAGIGAPDWNIARPVRVENASLIYQATSDQPLELPFAILDSYKWQNLPIKNISSPVPTCLYPDGGFPYNAISLWPTPSISNQVALYLWQQLSAYAALTDAVVLPQGYLRTLQYTMAVELAPRYERAKLTKLVIDQAIAGVEHLKSLNTQPYELEVDQALLKYPYGGYGSGLIGLVGGGGGSGGGAVEWLAPSNSPDGVTTDFIFTQTPMYAVWNGLIQISGSNYITVAVNTIRFVDGSGAPQAPSTGDVIRAAV